MNSSRLYHTIRHLRPRQVLYRLWYPVKKKVFREGKAPERALAAAIKCPQIAFTRILYTTCFDPGTNMFTFLNLSHSFKENTDWDFPGHGRLWTYNLNYFDWLQDDTIAAPDRLATIRQYIAAAPKTGKEPYPISLRGINWICFLSSNQIKDNAVNAFLYRNYLRLAAFPEYHISANHLLENAYSLFFAAHYFNEEKWHRQSVALLRQELNEQILPDGGHYERSPMYHSILLGRLLQCMELAMHSGRWQDEQLFGFLREKAALMTGWLKAFVFADGSFAMMGDSAPGIAPLPETLFAYAGKLGIHIPETRLEESGFCKMTGQGWELLANTGAIQPAYQPGHAHADTFSFCLQANGKPLIVDTGIATYETGAQRLQEKSTAAHNTITIAGRNSSDIWHGFRVGKRASVQIMKKNTDHITVSHDGYADIGVVHERSYIWNNRKIIVEDAIKRRKGREALLHLHFHPDVLLQQTGENTFLAGGTAIEIKGGKNIQLLEYQFCAGFNKRTIAQQLKVCATDRIGIVIEF